MGGERIDKFFSQVIHWGENDKHISAVILVGSYARGQANPDSDVDLVILADEPALYFKHRSWQVKFGKIIKKKHEDWGKVQSLRVWYEDGLEVEFGFTSDQWLAVPLDPGTRKALNDGHRFLVDKKDWRSKLDFIE